MKAPNTEHKATQKENTRKWTLRIFALLLAFLLVGSTFYTLIALLAEHV